MKRQRLSQSNEVEDQKGRRAAAPARASTAHPVLRLQHAIGNQALGGLIQSRLDTESPSQVPDSGEVPIQGPVDFSETYRSVERGVSGVSTELPFMEHLAPSFGPFAAPLSVARSFVDESARVANERLDSSAFTIGDRVAFRGPPDLHTTAHEATHIVQQRSGLLLPDGVGTPGDPYERQADAVADRVARGYSAEPILRPLGSGLSAGKRQFASLQLQTSTSSASNAPPVETPAILAQKMREAFRGWGTDEDEVYRILRFPGPVVREMYNYYNDYLNDHTGQGLIEDIKDEFSGNELTLAMSLLNAAIAGHEVEVRHVVPSQVAGNPNLVWVGLIVRGKWSRGHHPGVMAQHADIVMPGSGGMETRGFFGDQQRPGFGSSASSGSSGSGSSGRGSSAGSSILDSIGLGMRGVVADFDWFLAHRPYYVDLELAKVMDVKSALILVKVSRSEAARLATSWDDLAADPGTFNILGQNCSTAAAAGFESAAIGREISGLDTPDHLYEQLRERYHDAYMISGYYGYTRAARRWSPNRPLPDHPGSGPWLGPYVVEKRLR